MVHAGNPLIRFAFFRAVDQGNRRHEHIFMSTYDEFRKYASECLESAKNASNEEERVTYLDMAEHWLRAAVLAADKAEAPGASPASAAN
jgi:hypothetical protein